MAEQNDPSRELVQKLASESLRRGDPTGWFEQLYAGAAGNTDVIPWVRLLPNPNLIQWLDRNGGETGARRAMVVGCGLGDDAEELAHRGFFVTAFDISAAAIGWAKRRFQDSKVKYAVADLFNLPQEWKEKFDLVVEIYTIQALPLDVRQRALQSLASLVAPAGELLYIGRGRDDDADAGNLPWPISRAELRTLIESGLKEISFEDYLDEEDPPVRRFRAL